MLKIKDSVDLKELEKFGFLERENEYVYMHSDRHHNFFVKIKVLKKDRTIESSIYYDNIGIDFIEVIRDLVQAGLVEKVM